MALKSMTAFACAESSQENSRYRCEIKALNSRYLDINIRLPRSLATLEPRVIQEVKATLHRGKVDLFFDITSDFTEEKLPSLSLPALAHYLNLEGQALKMLKSNHKELTPAALNITELFHLDGVLESKVAQSADEALAFHGKGILSCTKTALGQLVTTREREGTALKQALLDLLAEVTQDRQAISAMAASVQEELFANTKQRLENLIRRLRENGQQVVDELNQERLSSELVILADKADIAEELTRLEIHENEFQGLLAPGNEVGRKLDFLCQEMHREANTMGNKLLSGDVSKHILNIKQSIERIRQQVQNIE